MLAVDPMMFFLGFVQFAVERSKEFLFFCNVVAGPLAGKWEDEWYAIFLLFFGAGAPSLTLGGRDTPWKSSRFDDTLGYPGEDVHPLYFS